MKDYGYYEQLKSENDNSETDNLNNELLANLMSKIDILTKRLDNVESYLEQIK